ncbi:hypothetical protein AC579_774 [Pseudocercospora musae]|uniref:Uncharacterized protein n=1 Tax=Pseudocercospora musae TaxID=113226 RepID=A0A139IH29_9PEZI|nr:hypothetical protein AC579_774 [Pseudocercospora musae]
MTADGDANSALTLRQIRRPGSREWRSLNPKTAFPLTRSWCASPHLQVYPSNACTSGSLSTFDVQCILTAPAVIESLDMLTPHPIYGPRIPAPMFLRFTAPRLATAYNVSARNGIGAKTQNVPLGVASKWPQYEVASHRWLDRESPGQSPARADLSTFEMLKGSFTVDSFRNIRCPVRRRIAGFDMEFPLSCLAVLSQVSPDPDSRRAAASHLPPSIRHAKTIYQ